MIKPVRIQRKRTKGFDLQAASRAVNGLDCVYVGRPTKYGNPHAHDGSTESRMVAAQKFYDDFDDNQQSEKIKAAIKDIKKELRGKNLACWCPLDEDCHADVLLEIANEWSIE